MPKLSQLGIEEYFALLVEEINSSYRKARISHKSGNIPTAGDTVERYVRNLIKDRIPTRHSVTQGHIVDQHLTTSGQFDVLIADEKGSPTLATYENGTQFLTYESIYSIGEVKCSYSKKRKEPIGEFIEKIQFVNEQMQRKEIDPFQQSQEYHVSANNFGKKHRTNEGWLYKNPLFKFMFFVNSKSTKPADVVKILQQHDQKHIPNLICFLDQGIALSVLSSPGEGDNGVREGYQVQLYPEFHEDNHQAKWKILQFTKGSTAILAYLIYSLNYHLSHCVVERVDLLNYHKEFFGIANSFPED